VQLKKLLRPAARFRRLSPLAKVLGNGLGMIPEWQQACQSSVKKHPRLTAIETIEIFHG
jgi:hypothetical protein